MTQREEELAMLQELLGLVAEYEGVTVDRHAPWALYLQNGPHGEYYVRQNWVNGNGRIVQRGRFFTYAQTADTIIDTLSAVCESYRNVGLMREALAEMGVD